VMSMHWFSGSAGSCCNVAVAAVAAVVVVAEASATVVR
jgi:hypothetical protein